MSLRTAGAGAEAFAELLRTDRTAAALRAPGRAPRGRDGACLDATAVLGVMTAARAADARIMAPSP